MKGKRYEKNIDEITSGMQADTGDKATSRQQLGHNIDGMSPDHRGRRVMP